MNATAAGLAGIAADAVVVLHLAFVAFVVLGGVLVVRRPRLAWLHLPAVAWGAWVELAGRTCPLTPLENALRRRAGEGGYPGGFIDHYLTPVLYPPGLGPELQALLGVAVLVLNAGVYLPLAWRAAARRRADRAGGAGGTRRRS